MAETRPKPEATEPKAEPRLLKSGFPAHQFTREDARKGGLRSAEVRKERAKSHSQRLRDAVERKERPLVQKLIELALDGDIRAFQTLWAYAYGTPAKVEPDELDVTMRGDEAPRAHDLAAVLRLAEQAGVDVTSSGINGNSTSSDA